MIKKTVIISPYDKDDIVNVNIEFDTLHMDVAKQYAYNKKIVDVTNGYNDLAALNYVVLFIVDDAIEVCAGLNMNNKQVNELRCFIDNYSKFNSKLDMGFGLFDKNKNLIITKKYDNIDDLLYENYKIKPRKGDIDVREKIRS